MGVRDFYNSFASRQLDVGVNKRHHFILENLISNGLLNANSLLEIGCGIGTVTGLIAKNHKTIRITAVDISDESIRIAQDRLKKCRNIKFSVGDILEIDLAEKFDFILLPDVLEHIPKENHFGLFSKIKGLLQKDGVVFINIPDPLYLEWVSEKHPRELQIIDQSLYLNHFVSIFGDLNFYITSLKSYSLWAKPFDYQFIVLKQISDLENFVR